MHYSSNIKMITSLIASVSCIATAYATPWTLIPLTRTAVTVPNNGTATVQYRVTNQSSKAHTLSMLRIVGVTQHTGAAGECGDPMVLAKKGDSCILSLLAKGNQLPPTLSGGPILCQQGGSCYQPDQNDTLNITLKA